MTKKEPVILVKNEGGVQTITLNRPKVLNAFSNRSLSELLNVFTEAEKDTRIRCLVLTGAERAFSSGQDLGEVAHQYQNHRPIDFDSHLRNRYNPIVAKIRSMEKLVIAAVNGVAAGAGCSLALACDLRVAAESASFILSFINVGLIPDAGSTFVLPRLIGYARALEMSVTGRKVTSQEALGMGLVNQVVPDPRLQDITMEFAQKIAKSPTHAIALIKRALNASLQSDLETQLDREALLQGSACQTRDHREGVAAFLAKRQPHFTGE